MKYNINELSLNDEKTNKRDQITEIVQNITKNIKLYEDEGDLKLLEKVLRACIKEKMDREASKMYRNIGKYHYYRNSAAKAFQYIEKALSISNKGKYNDLKLTYLSELGLLHFYELKYDDAQVLYDKAQRLLKLLAAPDRDTVFSLYYRYGVLNNYMGKYDKAFKLFKKAEEFAIEEVDKGRILMNMGVNRKRRGQFKMAENYYTKALEIFQAEGAIQECDIYNNLAELYKVTGYYDKAAEYIQKALVSLESRDAQRYFVYYETYIEIKILKGEVSQYLELLIELLAKVRDYFVHKCFLVDGFNAACNYIPEEKEVLKHLQEELSNTIAATACDNEDYRNELARCLADVCISLKLLSLY